VQREGAAEWVWAWQYCHHMGDFLLSGLKIDILRSGRRRGGGSGASACAGGTLPTLCQARLDGQVKRDSGA
jgi:hypothetical protein